MQSITRLLKRIGSDISSGKNLEGYVVSIIAIILAIMGVVDDAIPDDWKLAAILAAVGLLVFKTTNPEKQAADLDSVLLDRQSFTLFRDFIHDAQELWIYGPSAVNVLRDGADIKREVLDRGGTLRVLMQDPNEEAGVTILRRQLDKMFDLEDGINTSLRTLTNMASLRTPGKVEYGFIPYSPGFSMVVVDPDGRDGRLVIEFYGYQNEMIIERMHIVITRQQSQYWFEYWAKQFETMWDSRRQP
ncbi:MAG: hypothetical protein K8I30_17660 [Anaerolineae bacterium]|nr:hypothetical protein [Anaerolineae bacterium]